MHATRQTQQAQQQPRQLAAAVAEAETEADAAAVRRDGGGAGGSSSRSSGISSGVRLEGVAITFKGAQVLRDVSWDVKKGERVGLVGA